MIQMKKQTANLFFQEILTIKRPHLAEAQKAIQAYLKINLNGGPYRKMLMVNALTEFINKALQRYLTSIDRLKFNVLYSSLNGKQEQTTKKKIKTKKENTRRRINKGDPNLSMNEILQIVVCDQLQQQQNCLPPEIVRNQALTKQSMTIDIPPFQQDVILQLTQKVNSQADSLIRQEEIPKWEPSKLENYKNWLALTQNGISGLKVKRVQKTKKKSNSILEAILDKKIDISQGIDQKLMIDQLHTKLKSSKSNVKKVGTQIEEKIAQISAQILDTEQLVSELINKLRRFKRKHPNELRDRVDCRQPSYSFSPPQDFKVFEKALNSNESDKEHQNTQLQQYLRTELTFAKKIAFSDVLGSKEFKKSSIGNIFYDILHLNYKLKQAEPSEFGELLILAE